MTPIAISILSDRESPEFPLGGEGVGSDGLGSEESKEDDSCGCEEVGVLVVADAYLGLVQGYSLESQQKKRESRAYKQSKPKIWERSAAAINSQGAG